MANEVFQDEVIRATDLNRGSGDVLDRAAKGPITIMRNSEAFALMRRDVAKNWRRGAATAADLAEIIFIALSPSAEVASEHRWTTASDVEQKTEMSKELMGAFRRAVRDQNWEAFDAVLHEWSESGWAALSPELQSAFDAESEEVEIGSPDLGLASSRL